LLRSPGHITGTGNPDARHQAHGTDHVRHRGRRARRLRRFGQLSQRRRHPGSLGAGRRQRHGDGRDHGARGGVRADRGTVRPRPPGPAYQTGGTIDGINIAACLLDESTALLLGLRGTIPPEAALKSTDSTSLGDVAWYTSPEGSRIGMIDTQGDSTGGVIIAWVIIGGWQGFVINPAQFYFSDGAFTDKGILQPPLPPPVTG
jgi:hypothetical protein